MAISCLGKKCSIVKILFFIAVPITLWLIWSGTTSMLGKELVESNLKELSKQIARLGDSHGKDIKLSHGKIVIEGYGYKKKAIINDVVIEAAGKGRAAYIKFKVSTKNIAVALDPSNSNRLIAVLSNPINIYQGDSIVTSLSFPEPLIYFYLQSKIGNAHAFQHDVVFPKKITSVDLQSVKSSKGAGDSKEKTAEEELYVSFSKSPTLQFIHVPEHKKKSISYDLSGVKIMLKDNKKIEIGSFVSSLDEFAGKDKGEMSGKQTLSISDIVLYMAGDKTKPYAVNVDSESTYSEDKKVSGKENYGIKDSKILNYNLPKKKKIGMNKELLIKDFMISNPEFKLQASGNFSYEEGKHLPSGEVNVDIDDLPKFMDSELVAMLNRDLVERVLTKIAGSSLDGIKKFSTKIKRKKRGGFYIGRTTFKELMFGSIMPKGRPVRERLPDVSPILRQDSNKSSDSSFVDPSTLTTKP